MFFLRHSDEAKSVENGHDKIGDDDARHYVARQFKSFDAVRRLVNLAAADPSSIEWVSRRENGWSSTIRKLVREKSNGNDERLTDKDMI